MVVRLGLILSQAVSYLPLLLLACHNAQSGDEGFSIPPQGDVTAPNPPTSPTSPRHYFFEAEEGIVDGLTLRQEASASGGSYLVTTAFEKGTASYTFLVPQAGAYSIWARARGAMESFFVRMGFGSEEIFDLPPTATEWTWLQVTSRLQAKPNTFLLDAGQHTLTFRGRELNAAIDALVLANGDVPPEILGCGPETCQNKPAANPASAPPEALFGPDDFFAAPHGTSDGAGSRSRPWNLQTALNHPDSVKPGATIWLLEGTYTGGFTSTLSGTASDPITVRAVLGHKVRIDLQEGSNRNENNLYIDGDYTHFWGFEVLSTSTLSRQSQDSGPWPTDQNRGFISDRGSHNKFINIILHDTAGGFGTVSDKAGGEFYGCIVYNIGWVGKDRAWGPGFYLQNNADPQQLTDNIVFNNFGHGFQIYGDPPSALNHFYLRGNTLFHNGAGPGIGHGDAWDILLGGGVPVRDARVIENFTYHDAYRDSVQFGFSNNFSNDDLIVNGNQFVGSVRLLKFATIDASNNAVVRGNLGGNVPNSGFHLAKPTENQVIVRPNQYEAGRVHITVYNWELRDDVEADVSDVLDPGDAFQVHHVYDLEVPILTGNYQGNPIRIPMRDMLAPTPIGGQELPGPITLTKEFGVFLLRRTFSTTQP